MSFVHTKQSGWHGELSDVPLDFVIPLGGVKPVENSPPPGGLRSGASRREDFALLPLGERKFRVVYNFILKSARALVKLRSV